MTSSKAILIEDVHGTPFVSVLRCYSKHHFHAQPPRFYPWKLEWKHYRNDMNFSTFVAAAKRVTRRKLRSAYLSLPTVARLNYQIILYFKSGLLCYSKHHFHAQPPRFYPWKLEWKHYHVQPTSPQLSAPTSRRSLATTDRSAPRSTAPSPADFFPSPTHPHMQTRVRFGIQRKSNHQTRHTENEMPIYAIYRIGGPSTHLADG